MSDETSEARRRQIMDAVVDVTVTGGLQAATFRTIAEAAGVSVRLVQYYFGDKDRLLTDTLSHVGAKVASRIAEDLAELGDDPPPRQVIGTIFEAFLPLDEPRQRAMLVFIAFRTAALTDRSLASSDALGLASSLISHIEAQLQHAADLGHARHGLKPRSEAILLIGAMTGLSNAILAGDISVNEARVHLDYAIDRSLPGPAERVP